MKASHDVLLAGSVCRVYVEFHSEGHMHWITRVRKRNNWWFVGHQD